jgi:2-oxoisovalerate dehydrogenase E2 component (dihydrolipoyl transacylase)
MSYSPTDRDDTADHGLVPQTVEVTLPRLGGQVLEAIVVAWEKHPGEWVERDEPLCIVSTDGLRAAVASSASGHLVRLLAGVGVRIEAGASLAEIETDGVAPDAGEVTDPNEWAEEVRAQTLEPLEGDPFRELEPEPREMTSFHSPAVKRLAAEHGLDLSRVPGSGIGGRIRKEDVLSYLKAIEPWRSTEASQPASAKPG